MTRLGYQIPNFTYPDTRPDEIFDKVVAQARVAEAAGYDRVMVMDHFYQLPGLGAPDEPMFECYSMLSALAQHTEKVRLSALVTGNTYRNPTLLAKTITTLDHVSHGRATLGIGAGWFELEHDALGFEFGTFSDRFEKLEEALQIIGPMLRGERPTLRGKHYSAIEAVNSPPPVSKIPIMIGGAGEKKTLRMVAQYADRDASFWAERFEDALSGRGAPLRVLAVVSTHTTFLKYSMRDVQKAIQDFGHECRVLTEHTPYTIVGPQTQHQAPPELARRGPREAQKGT